MPRTLIQLEPGQDIRVTQTIHRREGSWTTTVEGRILEVLDAPTGSWYAHGVNDRYWLRRIRLRKPDGEITLVSLDPDSLISQLPPSNSRHHPTT